MTNFLANTIGTNLDGTLPPTAMDRLDPEVAEALSTLEDLGGPSGVDGAEVSGEEWLRFIRGAGKPAVDAEIA